MQCHSDLVLSGDSYKLKELGGNRCLNFNASVGVVHLIGHGSTIQQIQYYASYKLASCGTEANLKFGSSSVVVVEKIIPIIIPM
jgi:hypothetical protein